MKKIVFGVLGFVGGFVATLFVLSFLALPSPWTSLFALVGANVGAWRAVKAAGSSSGAEASA